jgi:hypothetical protein
MTWDQIPYKRRLHWSSFCSFKHKTLATDLAVTMPLCCRPRRANHLGRITGVRRPHWCFPHRQRYTKDPPTLSPKLEEERSPPLAALTDRRHLKVRKMSSLCHPGAVGPNRVENRAMAQGPSPMSHRCDRRAPPLGQWSRRRPSPI